MSDPDLRFDDSVPEDLSDSVDGDADSEPKPKISPLYPQSGVVEPLRPEELRWFYKKENDKKWTYFIGYDSLRLECKYRELHHGRKLTDETAEMVVVRGGLYEVDLITKTCHAIYWTANSEPVMRATWFQEGSFQPVEECFVADIEKEHIKVFLGKPLLHPGQKTGSKAQLEHSLLFKDFQVVWFSPSEVYVQQLSASSKLMRTVGNKLGLTKTGSRIYRGYGVEAKMDDRPPAVTQLVFVVHGIGQKMNRGSIIKVCNSLRDSCNHVFRRYRVPIESGRFEFLPVEWRTSLRLDGDVVESITPEQIKSLRNVLNSSVLDILYYSSPIYRHEILTSLESELNRLHELFCQKNPYFDANGGKVSIVAHSLGSVIMHDILTGWDPAILYEQFLRMNMTELFQENEDSSQASAAERLFRSAEFQKGLSSGDTKLSFRLENLFMVGSPLGVFLALRGIRPNGVGTQEDILKKSLSKRIFNIFHPSDPVAYRLEPLVLRHYSTISPVQIHRAESKSPPPPYQQVKDKAYAAVKNAEKASQSWFKWSKKQDMSAEMTSMPTTVKKAESNSSLNQMELEYRLDYALRQGNLEHGYVSAFTSHTSYWSSPDVALFIATHLHPDAVFTGNQS